MNMIQIFRRSTIAFASLLVATAFVGCNEEAPDYVGVVGVGGSTIEMLDFGPDGNEPQYITVSVEDGGWRAESSADWCTFTNSQSTSASGESGEQLGIMVAEVGATDRYANVTLTSGGASHNIIVSQSAFEDYIILGAASGEVDFDQTGYSFVVNTNLSNDLGNEWYALSSSPDWVAVGAINRATGEVPLIIEKNELYESRTAEIAILSKDASKEITATFTLIQGSCDAGVVYLTRNDNVVSAFDFTYNDDAAYAKFFKINTKNIAAGANGITYSVQSSDESWCEVSKTVSDAIYSVYPLSQNKTTENRYATITVVAKSGADAEFTTYTTLNVVQLCDGAPSLTLEKSSVATVQEQKSYAVPYLSDGEVTTEPNVEWISVSSSSNGLISFVVSENNDSEPRSGEIAVSSVKGGKATIQHINVTQEGLNDLDLQVTEGFEIESGEVDFKISAISNNATPTYLVPSVSWCSIKSGNTYTASENPSSTPRKCSIGVMVKYGNETLVKYVVVTQKGKNK